jgi:hypothetical protein
MIKPYLPLSHEVQFKIEIAPTNVEYVPFSHLMQLDDVSALIDVE